MINKKKRSRSDTNLRRVGRAVIQLAQAQAEVDAEASHLRAQTAEGGGKREAGPERRGEKDAA